jgi:hypothetical protein
MVPPFHLYQGPTGGGTRLRASSHNCTVYHTASGRVNADRAPTSCYGAPAILRLPFLTCSRLCDILAPWYGRAYVVDVRLTI